MSELQRDDVYYRFITSLAIRAKASDFKFSVCIHDLLIPWQSCLIFNHFDIINLNEQK